MSADSTPESVLTAAADRLEARPWLSGVTTVTPDVLVALAELLRHAAEYARLPTTVTVNGEDAASVLLRRELALAHAILGEGESRG